MPFVELLPLPQDERQLKSYFLTNFRRIIDAISRTPLTVGSEDIEITDSASGVILTAPNGTRYRVTVNNAGTLVTTAL